MDIDKVQRIKDSLKYYEDLKSLREREDLDSLSDFFRSMAIRPTSEELEKPVEVTEEPKPVVSVEEIAKTNTEPLSSEKPDNLFNTFRNYLSSVLASNEQQQLDDTIASQVQPDPIPATPETVKNMVELERTLTGLTKATPTLLKEQIKNAIPVNLITQEELDKQTSMINRGETEPVVTEQSSPVKSSDKVAATPDVKKDVEEKKQKDKEKSKAETIGTTYTSSSLYDSLKSPDEKIFNAAAKYLYDKGIIRTEWGDQKPLFDFVRYHSGGNSSAFGPGQIVYSTAQKMLDKGFIKDKETKQFAKKMIAAQKIFKNMIDNRNKYQEYLPKKAVNTKGAREEKWLETLGITEEEFLKYVKQGYFLPSNHHLSKQRRKDKLMTGIPLKILGDNYEKNYFNLYKVVLKEKLSRAEDLDSLLKLYHGSTNDALNKAYSNKTQGFLNLSTKQSGGMIESDPYKRQPRFI